MKGSFAPCFVAWNVGRERERERERETERERGFRWKSDVDEL